MVTLLCMIYPSGNSATRVAQLANIPHENWMQDWPVEVSDPERLDDFARLLLAHKSDWELSYWLLDLVLDSAESHLATTAAQDDPPERTQQLIDTLVAVYEATRAPAIAERLEYWADLENSDPGEMFRVSPLVREARRRVVAQ
ncbi:hypothetical protein [Nocardia ignorata]|uniref:hypothetical protein n=2 Tax=Nocardia ignorata TaxID=145285 RepID=UPI001060121E|nr:hypothetical protein [Nocardia ignorata]